MNVCLLMSNVILFYTCPGAHFQDSLIGDAHKLLKYLRCGGFDWHCKLFFFATVHMQEC